MTTARTAPAGVRVGRLDDLPIGEGRAFSVNGEQVAVFRLRDGQLRAVSAVCPHAGGPIADGQIDARVVICPLHLHAYELDTGCSTTAQPDLTTYPVTVTDDGAVVVSVRAEEPS
jgi:nitrite reductase (NADH) small subunit